MPITTTLRSLQGEKTATLQEFYTLLKLTFTKCSALGVSQDATLISVIKVNAPNLVRYEMSRVSR